MVCIGLGAVNPRQHQVMSSVISMQVVLKFANVCCLQFSAGPILGAYTISDIKHKFMMLDTTLDFTLILFLPCQVISGRLVGSIQPHARGYTYAVPKPVTLTTVAMRNRVYSSSGMAMESSVEHLAQSPSVPVLQFRGYIR